MKKLLCGLLAASFLNGCATEWRTAQPVSPITYRVPPYRIERSIGNLRRLAIIPVRVRHVGPFSVVTRSEGIDPDLTTRTAAYLSGEKGYEVVSLVDSAGAWRPEIIVSAEFGSADDLKTAWERASSKEEIADAVKKIGRALNVDGVVSIWLEEMRDLENIGDAAFVVLSVFPLFFTPEFYGLFHVAAEAVIYETFSGQAVWFNQFSGGVVNTAPKRGLSTYSFFANLENAIPAQLAK